MEKAFENYSWKFGISKFVSVSDEAFALLLFENNYDRWFSMAASGNWSSSTIQPMYTTGGNVKQTVAITSKQDKSDLIRMRGQYQAQSLFSSSIINTPTTAKYQGWSVAGIKCYNELYGTIDKERKSLVGIKFEEHFLEFCMNGKQASKHNHLKKKRVMRPVVRIYGNVMPLSQIWMNMLLRKQWTMRVINQKMQMT